MGQSAHSWPSPGCSDSHTSRLRGGTTCTGFNGHFPSSLSLPCSHLQPMCSPLPLSRTPSPPGPHPPVCSTGAPSSKKPFRVPPGSPVPALTVFTGWGWDCPAPPGTGPGTEEILLNAFVQHHSLNKCLLSTSSVPGAGGAAGNTFRGRSLLLWCLNTSGGDSNKEQNPLIG